ncbi:MAG: chemotaxis protein MotB [Micavibrio sp.]|nr:MAG: chemotaxis protein MotB [Micavibrio sp.]
MADDAKKDEGGGDTYIIKKIKKGGGHHGGAWKVAYADFVTAMMAFFLLLWLLNVSTDEQLNAISNYFDPTHPKVSQRESGSGGVLGGLTVAPEGAMTSTVQPLTQANPTGQVSQGKGEKTEKEKAKEKAREAEEDRFKEAQQALEQAIIEVPELAAMAENLIIDMTPEGLRIQMVDDDDEPMFASGSAQMMQRTQLLVGTIAGIIEPLPNDISVRGHTDSAGYGPGADYTNWELSADRANASRKALEQFGFPPERVNNVIGKADKEHLNPDDPYDSRNRRISFILLKEEITKPIEEEEETGNGVGVTGDGESTGDGEGTGDSEGSSLPGPSQPPPIGTFKKTPGAVEFP